MNRGSFGDRLEVPATLQSQLRQFRARVWRTKMAEAIGAAAAGLFAAYLVVFVCDRLSDTPAWVRAAAAIAVVAGFAIVPLFAYRWVWRRRRLEELARLLGHKLPRVGDQLLGVIELAASHAEQQRSPALCQAAIAQVAEDARHRDFLAAAPDSRARLWTMGAASLLAGAVGLLIFVPDAAANAWARLAAPWRDTPRYTFASIEPLKSEIVVPHGEPFTLTARLRDGSPWRPDSGSMQLGSREKIDAALAGDAYQFAGPPLIDGATAELDVGDWVQAVRITPKVRPELTSVEARIELPDYLGRPAPVTADVRGGSASIVRGSRIRIAATANRDLESATVDGRDVAPAGLSLTTGDIELAKTQKVVLRWQDRDGLAGKEPFTIRLSADEDAPPNLTCDDLPRRKVVLDSEQLLFHVTARDDFGIREVGMEWTGVGDETIEHPAKGDHMLAAGGHDKEMLDLEGTFTATSLGIEPQPIEVRLFARDYKPGRERVYSPPYLLYVLSAEDHAIWITEQLSRWHRQSLEVRDRELRLYEANKQLRALSDDELNKPDVRRRIEDQAAAERANGRRLSGLTSAGRELLRQAARNPEIGVGHLDRWAEMLEILRDIADARMPSVADLLNDASKATAGNNRMPASGGKFAGQSRAAGQPGPGAEAPKGAKAPPAAPRLVDMESTQQPNDPDAKSAAGQKKNPSTPTLRLPTTTVMGPPKGKPGATPAAQKMDNAVTEQKDLLAEFEKVADEMNEVLANLEGSTLVKRLKAAARKQYRIAGKLGDGIEKAFEASIGAGAAPDVEGLVTQEQASSTEVAYIMDDMDAYFERRRLVRFKTILDEMRKEDVIGSIRRLAEDLPNEQGLSIAQCEYWSDVMDRWAEDLVDPACSGACPGCRSKGSLPPSIVLEVLKILEGEINLREETRVAEQARPALAKRVHERTGRDLSTKQDGLDKRTVAVVERILELPDAEADFGKELALLAQVSDVMGEAATILVTPETGDPAIAAETEVIELLLKSKRINPNGGGGGGANPGGGGKGETKDTALALLGAGLNQQEVREDRGTEQAVGESGSSFPAEFRAGLDKYFSELERAPSGG